MFERWFMTHTTVAFRVDALEAFGIDVADAHTIEKPRDAASRASSPCGK